MRTLKTVIGLFILMATFTACDKDEGPEIDADASIVGYWQATKEIKIEFENGKKVDESTDNSPDFIIELRSDNRVYQDGELTGTYQISSDKKKITLNNEDGTTVFDIKQLSKSALVLYTEYKEQDPEEGDTYQENYEVYFKRIEK